MYFEERNRKFHPAQFLAEMEDVCFLNEIGCKMQPQQGNSMKNEPDFWCVTILTLSWKKAFRERIQINGRNVSERLVVVILFRLTGMFVVECQYLIQYTRHLNRTDILVLTSPSRYFHEGKLSQHIRTMQSKQYKSDILRTSDCTGIHNIQKRRV